MEGGSGQKPEVGLNQVKERKGPDWVLVLLRLVAFCATVSATLVMALNKETKTLVVATVGTNPIRATLVAKFQHTPAFVFFVVANAIASVHNLVVLLVDLFAYKFDFKGLRSMVMTISDMVIVALVSGAVVAAAFMADLGKKGNSHARWNKICDKFDKFCDHGGGALIASFIGLGFLVALTILSIINLHKKSTYQISAVP